MLKRHKILELDRWKRQKERLPLLLKGARQVGKTFLVREFSKSYPQIHEFNFQKDEAIRALFSSSVGPLKIIERLQIYSNKKIDIENDLIFFDEIQDCPEALNSLKFFAEDFPQAHIIGAGSLLGVYLSGMKSFPVGKVQFETLYPLSFGEFLEARERGGMVKLLDHTKGDKEKETEIKVFHQQFVEELLVYYITGGLPKIVSTYIEYQDVEKIRDLQNDLLTSYKSDFAKYSGPANALQILSVFEVIPKQLAKDNRKFQFKLLKAGSRYSEFASAIDWLVAAGLAYKVPIVHGVEIPLSVQTQESAFKLYFFDVGLLGALADIPVGVFSQTETLYTTFKGAFAENFFVQEFSSQRNEKLYCWQGKNSEVDFVFQSGRSVHPVEVKSGQSGKLKSLAIFQEKYKCELRSRVSLLPLLFQPEIGYQNIPLYMSSKV